MAPVTAWTKKPTCVTICIINLTCLDIHTSSSEIKMSQLSALSIVSHWIGSGIQDVDGSSSQVTSLVVKIEWITKKNRNVNLYVTLNHAELLLA